MEKVVASKNNLYFCNVKTSSDTKSLPKAAFFVFGFISKNIAVTSVVPVMATGFCLKFPTARITALILSKL